MDDDDLPNGVVEGAEVDCPNAVGPREFDALPKLPDCPKPKVDEVDTEVAEVAFPNGEGLAVTSELIPRGLGALYFFASLLNISCSFPCFK